jgi:hypothetical protein
MRTTLSPQLLQAAAVPDIFCTSLGVVEAVSGGCFRFVLYSRQRVGDTVEMVVVARIILPAEAILPAIVRAGSAIGLAMTASHVTLN